MTLENEELILLLQDIESDRVEYKESLSGDAPTKIREAICAFANDLPDHRKSGVVFVGARNDGSVVGLPVTDRLLQQLGDMKTDGNILPPPSITVEKRSIQGKDVAVVTVQPSDSPPVRCKGTIQIRIGPRRGIATAQDERILNEKRLYKDIPFDIQPIPSASLDDLNSVYFEHEYLSRAFAREIVEANERSREEQLAATKMIASADDPKPTILGMLVLGKWTQDYLPGAYVQFLRFMGRELADPISDEEAIGGSIADVLRRLDEKLNGHNRTAVDFISGPVERRASTYPIESDTADHPQRDHAPHLRVDQRPCACPLVRGSNRNHQPRRSLRESNRRQLRSRGRSRLSQSKRGGCHENPRLCPTFRLRNTYCSESIGPGGPS